MEQWVGDFSRATCVEWALIRVLYIPVEND